MGFSKEMDRIMHVELMTTPLSQQITLAEIVQRDLVIRAFPSYELITFTTAQNPVDTSMALIKDEQGVLWQVFLNPKLGEINGVRLLEEDWTVIVTDWHRFAFLGNELGKWLSVLSTMALLLVLFSGWIQSRGEQAQKRYSLHRLLGQWLTPLLLVVLVSGLLLFAQNAGWFATSMDWASLHQGDWLSMPGRLLWVVVSLCLAWLIIGGLWLTSTHKKDF